MNGSEDPECSENYIVCGFLQMTTLVCRGLHLVDSQKSM